MLLEIPQDLLADWNILVVDDEDDSLEVAQIILNEYGANVFEAHDGAEALEVVAGEHLRFVICDLSMPVLDGWGFIDEVKNNPYTADLPVIALTAHAMVGDRERALAAGFHNYLSKPLTVETFMQDLVKLLVDIPELAEHLNI